MRKSLFRIARNHSLFPSLLVRGITIANIMPIHFSSERLQQGGGYAVLHNLCVFESLFLHGLVMKRALLW